MKRSAAPSERLKKIRKLDNSTFSSILANERAHVKNHLQVLDSLLHPQEVKDDEEESKEEDDEDDSGPAPSKAVAEGDKPVYFWARWMSTSKNEGTREERGVLEAGHAFIRVYTMQGKLTGTKAIERGPIETDEETGNRWQQVTIKRKPVTLLAGKKIPVGTKKVTLIQEFPATEYENGTVFLKKPPTLDQENVAVQQAKELVEKYKYRPAATRKPTGFVCPFKGTAPPKKRTEPLHDPLAQNALVVFSPTPMSGKVAVVVDPLLCKCLRPHQRAGVQFMFDCTMGMRSGFAGNGCILADGMGLGKTIQAITPTGEPAVKKAIIVAPSSLVSNWIQGDAIEVVSIGTSSPKADKQINSLQYGTADVLVISYDQLKIRIEKLLKVAAIDLVICDEGHKLKNNNIKTSQAIARLKTTRRIILSGTPIQNDLEEFYAMVNFVNPSVLGEFSAFKKIWEEPILASKDPEATPEEREIGVARSKELIRITAQFILRRSSTINQKYLPPMTEYTVFCRPTKLQKDLYAAIVAHSTGAGKADALQIIAGLKKLCNHPALLQDMCSPDTFPWLQELFPVKLSFNTSLSGKTVFLDFLLKRIRAMGNDKIVIVSNYTQTLEELATWCTTQKYPFFQLDGKLSVPKRQEFVDRFNDLKSPEFIFLLSSKAGGCGLNLIGACHLVMLDPDWNPANDGQAMARVWRDGQKKNVRLYRTLVTGTIEEKIYQRQISKLALSSRVVDNTDVEAQFSSSELKDLFKLADNTICETHDLLNCKCGPSRKVFAHKRRKLNIDLLSSWQHHYQLNAIGDPIFEGVPADTVSFVFSCSKDASTSTEEEVDSDPPVEGEEGGGAASEAEEVKDCAE